MPFFVYQYDAIWPHATHLVIRKNPTRGSFFTPGKMFTVVGIENNANKPLTLQEVVSSPLSEAGSMLFELIT